jgi:hypothetical protein
MAALSKHPGRVSREGCHNLCPSGGEFILVDESAEDVATDESIRGFVKSRSGLAALRDREIEATMRPPVVVVHGVCTKDPLEVSSAAHTSVQSRHTARFLACWVIHAESGCALTPVTHTLVDGSITK